MACMNTMPDLMKFAADNALTSLVNNEMLQISYELKKFKKFIAVKLLEEEDRETVPNMSNFDEAFKKTWELWKSSPLESREEMCYPEFQGLFFRDNPKKTEESMSEILATTSGSVMELELQQMLDRLNLHKSAVASRMLQEPEEVMQSVCNLGNLEEAMRSGWKIWKKSPECDRETLSYEKFKDIMLNGSD